MLGTWIVREDDSCWPPKASRHHYNYNYLLTGRLTRAGQDGRVAVWVMRTTSWTWKFESDHQMWLLGKVSKAAWRLVVNTMCIFLYIKPKLVVPLCLCLFVQVCSTSSSAPESNGEEFWSHMYLQNMFESLKDSTALYPPLKPQNGVCHIRHRGTRFLPPWNEQAASYES